MSSAGCEGGEAGSEGAVEIAGDEAFEAADDFILGLAFCEAAVHVAASSFAVAHPDEDDHVQGSVGGAVAGEVEPVTAGAPARRWDPRGSAPVSEGRLGAEPVDVLARSDEQGRGVVSTPSETDTVEGAAAATSPSSRRSRSAASAPSRAMRRPRLPGAVLAAWAESARRSVSGRSRAHTAAGASSPRRPSNCSRNAASASPLDQRSHQSRAEGSGGLDGDRGDRPERREPCVGQAVTGTRRRERLGAQDPAQRVERGDDTEIGVAVNPTYHRLVWIWHGDVLHLEAASLPGPD